MFFEPFQLIMSAVIPQLMEIPQLMHQVKHTFIF